MPERDKRFNPPLTANQIIARPFRFILRPETDLNRHFQSEVFDALDDQFEFLLVALARIQNVNLRNGNHYYFIIHIVVIR